MESLTCKNCGPVDSYSTREVHHSHGYHIGAYCDTCGYLIKWLPQGKPPTCYIGKYKGVLVSDITDAGWLAFVLANVPIKPGQKEHYQSQLDRLTK